MRKIRWLPILGTSVLASGCGILLGMLLLSIFTNSNIETSKNSQDSLPKVVQASVMEGQVQTNDLTVNEDNNATVIEDKPLDEPMLTKEIFFPIMEWQFIQAGVFNDRSFATPIIQKLEENKLRPHMIAEAPSRVMVGAFHTAKQANDVAKGLSHINLELYVRELRMMYGSIQLQLPQTQADFYDVRLNNQIRAYFEQLQGTSYNLIANGGNTTIDDLKNAHKQLLATIEELKALGTNENETFLIHWYAELKVIEQSMEGWSKRNKEGAWILQGHLLKLLSASNVL